MENSFDSPTIRRGIRAKVIQRAYEKFEKQNQGRMVKETIGELFVCLMDAYEEVKGIERSDLRY